MSESVYTLSRKRLDGLHSVDMMSPGLRECVHEFGLPIVAVLTKFGIKDPRHIREIVREVWLGPRQTGQTSGAFNSLDYILARGPVTARTLIGLLDGNNLAIVPMSTNKAMVDASMAEVSGFNVRCTREEKHKRRLMAAIKASPYRPTKD